MPRPRSVGLLLAVAALALAPAAAAAPAAGGTLYVTWQQGVAINLSLPDGTPVTSASVIPPGSYAVIIFNNFRDDESIARMFHLRGPGVDYQTDLNQGEQVQETWAVTFQPSSTYTWDDDYRPGQVSGSFRTSATAAPAGQATGGSASGGTAPGGKAAKGGTTANADVAGAAVLPFRGALDAIVSKAGKLTLYRLGKKVARLKSGRYTFSVDDESKRSGFAVQQLRRKAVTVTTGRFVGSHDLTIALRPGQWWFFSPGGARHYFIVVA
ncbi:MAG TPA: hypothetical protein VFA66_00020 [Gaiellaceae bacterium]|nr:hypothetical protein [Gaiellaceae bacterium]